VTLRELAVTMATTFALLATRMAVFAAVSPFPGQGVPGRIRVGFALLLALAAMSVAPPGAHVELGPRLAVAAFGEVAAGAAIGLVFRVGLAAADVLGASVASAMGLTFAASYDPAQAASSDALTRLVTSAAMLVSLASGAHRVVIGAAVASTRVLPVGGALDIDVYGVGLIQWTARSMECGLGLALPAITVALVVQIALGLVARAAPSLQVFSVGLSVTLGSGFVVLLAGVRDMAAGIAAHVGGIHAVLEGVLSQAR